MFNAQEKASVVQEYIRTGSIAITHRYVVRSMGKRPPSPASIRRWHQRFIQTESGHDIQQSERPRLSAERINAVCQLFNATTMTSLRHAEIQLQIPCSTIQKIIKQPLSLYPYKLQTPQELTVSDKLRHLEFAQHALTQSCGASEYLSKIVFSDECIFV